MHGRDVPGRNARAHLCPGRRFFYACPTRELARYVTTIVGIFAAQVILIGKMPNLSDKTGEPEFTGKMKDIIDALRGEAGVATFDDAAAKCIRGVGDRRVTVLNMPVGPTSLVAYVEDDLLKRGYWMPIGSLDKLSDFGRPLKDCSAIPMKSRTLDCK
jgi:hypothetical protein